MQIGANLNFFGVGRGFLRFSKLGPQLSEVAPNKSGLVSNTHYIFVKVFVL